MDQEQLKHNFTLCRPREDLPSKRNKLPFRLQHIRDGRLRRLRQHLGRLQQETALPVPPLQHRCVLPELLPRRVSSSHRLLAARRDADRRPKARRHDLYQIRDRPGNEAKISVCGMLSAEHF